MGLLDKVTGMLGKKKTGAGSSGSGLPDLGSITSMLGGGGKSGLLKVLLPALMGQGALGAKLGGLGGLLDKLRSSGLGDKVSSWVGTGGNEEVHPDELERALGSDTIDQVAGEAGMPRDEAKSGMASLLPKLVDQLSPGGSVPGGSQLGSMLGKLDLKSLLG